MTSPKRIFLSPPHMGGREQEFVQQAFASNYIAPLGPMVDAFEAEFSAYTGIPHCVALSSGTSATHLALRHLGVGPGDEVMASTLTFIGSVTPATFQGATPVFIDCNESSWNMNPALLEQALEDAARRGQLPKAVIPTDLYGQPCDLPRIRAICDRHGVPVICDSAEAMGAKYQGTGDRGQETGDRGQRTEDRGQRTVIGPRTSDLGPRTSGLGPRTRGGMRASTRGRRSFRSTATKSSRRRAGGCWRRTTRT